MRFDKITEARQLALLIEDGQNISSAARLRGLNTATVRSWYRDGGEFREIIDEALRHREDAAVTKPTKEEAAASDLMERFQAALSKPKVRFTPPYSIGNPHRDTGEEAHLILSDLHCGRKTETFNAEVYVKRCERIVEKVIKLVDLQRRSGSPINRLNIWDLGDNVHGERVGQQGRMQDFEFGIPEQLALSVPTMSGMVARLAEHFTEIIYRDSPGNHGNLDKKYSTGSNWDWVRVSLMEGQFKDTDRIRFERPLNVNQAAVQFAQVGRWRYAYMHGDCIRSSGGSPYAGILRKFAQFQVIESGKGRPFHLGMLGHFHHTFFVNQNRLPILMNGTAVTDDEYALELGYDSEPQTWLFGSNNNRPLTFKYEINMEESSAKTPDYEDDTACTAGGGDDYGIYVGLTDELAARRAAANAALLGRTGVAYGFRAA